MMSKKSGIFGKTIVEVLETLSLQDIKFPQDTKSNFVKYIQVAGEMSNAFERAKKEYNGNVPPHVKNMIRAVYEPILDALNNEFALLGEQGNINNVKYRRNLYMSKN